MSKVVEIQVLIKGDGDQNLFWEENLQGNHHADCAVEKE